MDWLSRVLVYVAAGASFTAVFTLVLHDDDGTSWKDILLSALCVVLMTAVWPFVLFLLAAQWVKSLFGGGRQGADK